jgi:hypothetical protein
MADLNLSPLIEAMVKAQGDHSERVERAADLSAIHASARHVVMTERRYILLNIIHPY